MSEAHAAKLPNFIIAGAPISGTTSLYQYLCQHPQVYMCPIKEPAYFAAADIISREDLRPILRRQRPALQAYLNGRPPQRFVQAWVTEWDDYVQLFRHVRDEIAIGEASVGYIWLPSAAPAIRAKLPGVRLIFILRDPAERLFSAYLKDQKHNPGGTFRAWVLQAMQAKGAHSRGIPDPIPLEGGFYATHLQRFLDLFPREQMRFYLYESFRADPQGVLQDILTFLGVDPHHPIDLSHRLNETSVLRFPALARLHQQVLRGVPLATWLPAPVAQAFREFYYQRKDNIALSPDDRRLVIDYYRDEILSSQDMIGINLSAWLH
jgi:hypothetical protein